MKKSILVIAVLLFCINGFAQSTKYGALAIDKSNGFYYGWAYDYSTLAAAENKALQECKNKGGNAVIVLTWSGAGCAVYRTIDGNVGTAYGWGISSIKASADAIATKEALKRSGGVFPKNYVWACNSVETDDLKIIRNDAATNDNKLTGLKDSAGDIFNYEGEILNNLPNGSGTATYENGGRFTGNYLKGEKNGQGTFNFKSGSRYVGNWKNDKEDGKGIQYFKSGAKYEGDFVAGQMEGKGVYRFASGNRYTGDFKNSKMHGYGKWHDATDGSSYEGDYVNGLMHGQGKYMDATGKIIFEGRMENDKPVQK